MCMTSQFVLHQGFEFKSAGRLRHICLVCFPGSPVFSNNPITVNLGLPKPCQWLIHRFIDKYMSLDEAPHSGFCICAFLICLSDMPYLLQVMFSGGGRCPPHRRTCPGSCWRPRRFAAPSGSSDPSCPPQNPLHGCPQQPNYPEGGLLCC